MKLLMNDKRADLRSGIGKAFYWLAKEYGIADKPFKVKIIITNDKPSVEIVESDDEPFILRSNFEFGGVDKVIKADATLDMFINEFRSDCKCNACSKIRKKNIYETLVHEMTHVKQMVEGRLTVNEDNVKWSGWNKAVHIEDLPAYEDHPWEHEANANEEKFYPRLKAYLEKEGVKC